MSRGPWTTLIVGMAVAGGIGFAAMALGRHLIGKRAPPDLHLVDASQADLVAAGFQLTGNEPPSWSRIHLRAWQDDERSITVLRCAIAPKDAERLVSLPPGARRPADDAPPADWERGKVGDPWLLPAWFQPKGAVSVAWWGMQRGRSAAIFANYDPASQILHFWQWQRDGNHLKLAEPPTPDLIAQDLETQLRRAGTALDDGGWIGGSGLASPLLPGAVCALHALPRKDRHRYLLRIVHPDGARLKTLTNDYPLRPATADPRQRWSFAAPAAWPAWWPEAVSDTQAHILPRLSDGHPVAGRWIARDGNGALVVWDWSDDAQPSAADLTVP